MFMDVGFATTISDDENGFTLAARFLDVRTDSTVGQLGLRISKRVTDILRLDLQGQRFRAWGFHLQSGVYAGRRFEIVGPRGTEAALTEVSVLTGGVEGSLEIQVFGQLVDLNTPPFVPPPGTIEYRRRREKDENEVSLKRNSSRGNADEDEDDDEEPPPPLYPTTFPPIPELEGYDDDFDELLGSSGGRKPREKKTRIDCEMCKVKLGVLSSKQCKDVAYCGVACYLGHKNACQKKD